MRWPSPTSPIWTMRPAQVSRTGFNARKRSRSPRPSYRAYPLGLPAACGRAARRHSRRLCGRLRPRARGSNWGPTSNNRRSPTPASFPSDSSRTTCARMAPPPAISGSRGAISAGDERTTASTIRISQPDGRRARCNASGARARPRNCSQPMPPFTTSSMSNGISPLPKRIALFARRR